MTLQKSYIMIKIQINTEAAWEMIVIWHYSCVISCNSTSLITERLGLEGAFWFQPTFHGQEHIPPDQSPILPGFEYLQE